MTIAAPERPRPAIRVLIVDDVAASRETLRRALAFDLGIEVVGEAGTGASAIEQAEALRPDLVLMDVRMPDGNGIEATRNIVGRFPRTKVMALTAYDDVDTVRDMLAAGAAGYFLKGASVDDLLTAVHRTHVGEEGIDERVLPGALKELRRLLADERSRREEVEHLARIRQEFMQVLSHELRTPLTVMLGALRLVQRRDLRPQEEAVVEAAVGRAAELQLMVEGLELVGEPPDAQPSEAHPAQAARDAIQRLGLRPETTDLREEVWAGVRARHLSRVAYELLSNAFRHGASPVMLRTYRDGARRVLEVSDAGDLEPSARLFEAFAQQDMSSTRESGGLGLGLFVARRLCEADGGALSIRREGDRTIAEARYHVG